MSTRRLYLADPVSWTVGGRQIGHCRAVVENYQALFGWSGRFRVAGGPAYAAWCAELFRLPYGQSDARGHVRNKIAVLLNCWALFRAAHGETIVFQSVGFATLLLGILLFSSKSTRVFLIRYRSLANSGCVARLFFWLTRRKVAGVLCPSSEVGRSYCLPFCVVPDYFYVGSPQSFLVDRLPTCDFVSVGIQSRDKGALEFAQRLKGTSLTMLIAGFVPDAAYATALRELASENPNVWLNLDYLDGETYARAISCARFCVLNYSDAYDDHSSGVVYDMLYRGKPIVGRRCRALDFVEREGLGFLYDDLDEVDFSALFESGREERYRGNLAAFLRRAGADVVRLADFLETNLEGNP